MKIYTDEELKNIVSHGNAYGTLVDLNEEVRRQTRHAKSLEYLVKELWSAYENTCLDCIHHRECYEAWREDNRGKQEEPDEYYTGDFCYEWEI